MHPGLYSIRPPQDTHLCVGIKTSVLLDSGLLHTPRSVHQIAFDLLDIFCLPVVSCILPVVSWTSPACLRIPAFRLPACGFLDVFHLPAVSGIPPTWLWSPVPRLFMTLLSGALTPMACVPTWTLGLEDTYHLMQVPHIDVVHQGAQSCHCAGSL